MFNEYYMTKRKHIAWRGPIIAQAIVEALDPASVLDFGCATGDYAAGLLDLGVQVLGLDSSHSAGGLLPDGHFEIVDLSQALHETYYADLGILLEVLSVIEYNKEAVFENCLAACDRMIVNHEPYIPDGWAVNEDATCFLRGLLLPWADKQAIKALYRTGKVIERV